MINYDPRRMEETILLGKKYMDEHFMMKISKKEFLINQFKYISPYLWLCQFLLMIFAASIINIMQIDINVGMIKMMPFLSLSTIPELFKDLFYDMLEVEKSCKFKGSMVLVPRLLMVSLVNYICIFVLLGYLSMYYYFDYLYLLLISITVYNLAIFISMLFIHFLHIQSRLNALMFVVMMNMLLIIIPEAYLPVDMFNHFSLMISSLLSYLLLIYAIKYLDYHWLEKGSVSWH